MLSIKNKLILFLFLYIFTVIPCVTRRFSLAGWEREKRFTFSMDDQLQFPSVKYDLGYRSSSLDTLASALREGGSKRNVPVPKFHDSLYSTSTPSVSHEYSQGLLGLISPTGSMTASINHTLLSSSTEVLMNPGVETVTSTNNYKHSSASLAYFSAKASKKRAKRQRQKERSEQQKRKMEIADAILHPTIHNSVSLLPPPEEHKVVAGFSSRKVLLSEHLQMQSHKFQDHYSSSETEANFKITVWLADGHVAPNDIEALLWLYPCGGQVVSIKASHDHRVVMEILTAAKADAIGYFLIEKGYCVSSVQQVGARGYFDCPRNYLHLSLQDLMKGLVIQNSHLGLIDESLALVSTAPVKKIRGSNKDFYTKRIYVDFSPPAVDILNCNDWKLYTVSSCVKVHPVN